MSSWTTGKVLSWTASDFKKRGIESPRLEAEVLLAHVLKCDRINLYTGYDRPLLDNELAAYRDTISRRRNGEPTAYITGTKEFWSLNFEVDSSVLIPRPDTETLVGAVLDRAPDEGRFLDLGTGTGCVAIALASELKNIEIDAVDISPQACRLARRNAEKHHVADRIRVLEGDLFAALPPNSSYIAIVSNPPYIPMNEISNLSLEVQKEPRVALDGGPDGLDVVRRIICSAPDHLEPSGWLLVEIDPRQARKLKQGIGFEVFGANGEFLMDLAGHQRVAAWQRR
jgi:release factor glutamine methyltransferase